METIAKNWVRAKGLNSAGHFNLLRYMAMLSHPRMTGGIFAFEIKPTTAPVLAFNF
jgi:hypothetical protein